MAEIIVNKMGSDEFYGQVDIELEIRCHSCKPAFIDIKEKYAQGHTYLYVEVNGKTLGVELERKK